MTLRSNPFYYIFLNVLSVIIKILPHNCRDHTGAFINKFYEKTYRGLRPWLAPVQKYHYPWPDTIYALNRSLLGSWHLNGRFLSLQHGARKVQNQNGKWFTRATKKTICSFWKTSIGFDRECMGSISKSGSSLERCKQTRFPSWTLRTKVIKYMYMFVLL